MNLTNNAGNDLEAFLREKSKTTQKLNDALTNLTKLEISYETKSNELWVTTNFSEVIVESRPTVDMKKAYIDNELKDIVSKIKIERNNVEVLKNDLKVTNALIKAEEKYIDVFCKITDAE